MGRKSKRIKSNIYDKIKDKFIMVIKNIKKVMNSNKFEVISLIMYKLILDIIFLTIIQQSYNENNQFSANFNLIKYITGWIVVIFIYYLNNKSLFSVPKFFVKLFILLMLVPISVLYGCKNEKSLSYLMIVASFVIFIFTAKLLIDKFGSKKNYLLYNYELILSNVLYYIFIAITFILIVACFYYNGLPNLKVLDLRNVYEVRDQFYLPKYFYYMYEFENGFIIYFLIVTSLFRKNYKNVFMFITFQVLLFLWKGDKSAIFGVIAVVLLTMFLKQIDLELIINKIFLSITAISYLLFYAFTSLPFLLFIRRMLIVPANLKYLYIEFFTTHEKIGIVGTVLNAFIKLPDPYNGMPYQNLISELYFNKKEMWSNTGFLIEGFAREGFLGVMVIACLMGFVLYIMKIGTDRLGKGFVLSISLIPFITLNDGYLFSSFIFGSIGLLCLVCYFFDYKKIKPIPHVGKLKRKVLSHE